MNLNLQFIRLTLTLQSREKAFFVDLKDRLITAFNEANNKK
jgi:hypothetical protein